MLDLEQRTWKSLVTSAEIIRCIWIYLFMGCLSSLKNAWLLNTQRTGIACIQVTKDDVYMNAYHSIASLPRKGMHHFLVGQTVPFLLALIYCILPFLLRSFKNKNLKLSRHFPNLNVPNSDLSEVSSANTFAHIVGASWAGEPKSISDWNQLNVFIATICLSGFSMLFASVLIRLFVPCCGRGLKRVFGHVWRSFFLLIVILTIPIILFQLMILENDERNSNSTSSGVNSTIGTNGVNGTNGIGADFFGISILTSFVMFLLLEFILHDQDAHHIYNETNKILFGPIISFLIIFYLYYADYQFHDMNINGDDKDGIKCVRLVLMYGSCCVCYVQSVTLLKVLFATYKYFEHKTKLMELFTLSSRHPSWYAFFRRFARSKRRNKSSKVHTNCCVGCSIFCECCDDADLVDPVNSASAEGNVNNFNRHERVVQKIRFGPYDRHGRHNEDLSFTAFDLTVKSEVIHWNATRKRLMEECNSTETEVRTVNLQFIITLSGVLFVLVALRMLQQHGKQTGDGNFIPKQGGAVDMLEHRISNSSMNNMVGLIAVTILCTFPTWYQRQKLASIQNSHIGLLADMKHSVSLLSANQDQTDRGELDEVVALLEKTSEKLQVSDKKPVVFGIEIEAWSMRSVGATMSSIFIAWLYFDSGIVAGVGG